MQLEGLAGWFCNYRESLYVPGCMVPQIEKLGVAWCGSLSGLLLMRWRSRTPGLAKAEKLSRNLSSWPQTCYNRNC